MLNTSLGRYWNNLRCFITSNSVFNLVHTNIHWHRVKHHCTDSKSLHFYQAFCQAAKFTLNWSRTKWPIFIFINRKIGTLNWMNGFNMTKSGILTVTTKSRNFHSGVPPEHNNIQKSHVYNHCNFFSCKYNVGGLFAATSHLNTNKTV